jgi:acetoacetyl-CoA synthetase
MFNFESGYDPGLSESCQTLEGLSSIWQRVLRVSSIKLNDSFFDLGGNLPAADLLFAEVNREFKRELPSATILHAPTLAMLAEVLQSTDPPQFPNFLCLKKGKGKPPVFIAPGLDGRADFSTLARRIQTEHAIYGLLAKGVDGSDEPLARIEDMAEFYLRAISNLQPQGPYVLVGYSFGGLVALEMARRILEGVKEVGLLVLIDAYPHPRFLSTSQRLRLSLKRASRHLSEIRRRPVSEAISYVRDGLERRYYRAGLRNRVEGLETSPLSIVRATSRIKDHSYAALRRYRPRFYPGTIRFVKNENDAYFPGDPIRVWAKLATALQVETVTGTHLNIVTTNFESLAAVLTRYLKEEL